MKAFGEFFNNQIAYATVIVLSRTQNLKPEQTETVVKEIRKKNDKAAIITTPWDEIDGKQIYKVIEQQKSLEEELMEAHHSQHEEHSTCGCHDHHEHSECGHEHEHSHHEHEKHEHSHHEHGEHEHNHCEHSECGHGHEHSHHEHEEHEHNHHEHGECGHGHGEHDHHGHDHSEHGENCTCGCHDHHHHHADEVFTSWGRETPHVFAKETIEHAMKVFCETEDYGTILRAKGMVPCEDGTWIYFDMVDGEYELRTGEADYTGRLCVIGTELQEEKLEGLFGIS